jgi:hypothetical protein
MPATPERKGGHRFSGRDPPLRFLLRPGPPPRLPCDYRCLTGRIVSRQPAQHRLSLAVTGPVSAATRTRLKTTRPA